MPKKKEEVKPPKKLSDAKFFELAEEYVEAHVTEKKMGQTKTDIRNRLVQQFLLYRDSKTLTSRSTGTRVTFSQAEHVEYDPEGIWGALKPKQRREVFDENVNLNALPAETRKAVIEFLKETVEKDELEEVTTRTLNIDKLASAVQAGSIRAKLVAKFAKTVKSAPYVNITPGKS